MVCCRDVGRTDSLQCFNIVEEPKLEESVQPSFTDESLGVSTTEETPIGVEERRALAIFGGNDVFSRRSV